MKIQRPTIIKAILSIRENVVDITIPELKLYCSAIVTKYYDNGTTVYMSTNEMGWRIQK